jgi:hypothetical protein
MSSDHSQLLPFQHAPIPMATTIPFERYSTVRIHTRWSKTERDSLLATIDSELHNVMASSTTNILGKYGRHDVVASNINIFNTSRMMTAPDRFPTLFPVTAATANSSHHNIGTTSHSAQ